MTMDGTAVIDMRSDFVAPPTAGMLSDLAEAATRLAGFGLREDAAQAALERRGAELLGKEDALFFPTCTMANLVAVLLQVPRGQLLLTPHDSHIATSEAGGASGIAGAMVVGLSSEDGVIPQALLRDRLTQATDAQRSRVALVALEDSHNRSGGQPLPPGYVESVAREAHRHGARLHVDGARLFNSAVAAGRKPADLVLEADTVSVSLNKGLAAPNGAILAGPRGLVDEAVSLRQQLGGGMRPSGMLSAAGLLALDRIGELAADHSLARDVARALAAIDPRLVDPARVTTNIVLVQSPSGIDREFVLAGLARQGVLAIAMGDAGIRFCIHRGVPPDAPVRVAAALRVAIENTQQQLDVGETTNV